MRSQGSSQLRGSFSMFAKVAWRAASTARLLRSQRRAGARLVRMRERPPSSTRRWKRRASRSATMMAAAFPANHGSTVAPTARRPTRIRRYPKNVKDLFSGPASTSGQPEIVYPLTGSMHAMNQGDINFQWNAGVIDEHLVPARCDRRHRRSSNSISAAPTRWASARYQMPEIEWLDLGDKFRGADVTFTVGRYRRQCWGRRRSPGRGVHVQADHDHVLARAGHRRSLLLGGGVEEHQAVHVRREEGGCLSSSPTRRPTSTPAWLATASAVTGRSSPSRCRNLPHGENTSAIQTAPTDRSGDAVREAGHGDVAVLYAWRGGR